MEENCIDKPKTNNCTKGYGKQSSKQSNADIHTTQNMTDEHHNEIKSDTEKDVSAKVRWGKLKTTIKVNVTPKKKGGLDRGDSFLRKFSTRKQSEAKIASEWEDAQSRGFRYSKHRTWSSYVIHPSGGLMFYWLGVITLAVMYNLWTCIARDAFREIQEGYMIMWFCLDGFCDFIYVCDVIVQFRTGYLQQGLMVYDTSKLCKNYLKDKCFIVDIVCLLPLDFLQFYTGIHPMLRFPRFLKIYRGVRFMHMYESRTAYPNLLRVANLSHILFLGSHWFAAFYYLISEAEGFEGDWSYPSPEGKYAAVTRKYLASLYWSTLTLTTIGDLPPPDTNWQYVFVIVSYLIGVFIFATIVGQVGNVITNRNASRQEFERLLDGAKFYMQMHNVPTDLQKRVQRWYDYVWTRGRLNCNDINSLGLLPDKLKTELALHVNLGTLKKVTIFQKCRPEFLHDLMLKMRAYIFTPGDLICRRGEVAREMFIIADGVVEILGENNTILTQMSTGDFFGEIGILNLDGGINRRTADVRSVGYAELFVLSREDVLAALKDHPDAEQIIREYGQRRLKETEEHRRMVRSSPNSPDPSCAWKGHRISNKSQKNDQNSNTLHLPQVKYLPSLSPKLKSMFRIKTRRGLQRQVKRQKSLKEIPTDLHLKSMTNNIFNVERNIIERICSHQTENGIATPISNLDAIPEKDGASETEYESGTDKEDIKGTDGSFRIADVVLNLLKKKRQMRYTAVNSDESDIDNPFSEIKIQNLNEVTSVSHKPTCKSMQMVDNNAPNNTESNQTGLTSGKYIAQLQTCDQEHSEVEDFSSDELSPTNQERIKRRSNTLSLPKIVLTTHAVTNPSSRSCKLSSAAPSSSESESTSPPPRPHYRNHVTRKSSPSVLAIPTNISESFHRRLSIPPPLDLPIEPPFSSLRGMSIKATDVEGSLNRFKITMERRLDCLEDSYKETMLQLRETTAMQEKMMKTILRKLASPKAERLEPREDIDAGQGAHSEDDNAFQPNIRLTCDNLQGTDSSTQLESKQVHASPRYSAIMQLEKCNPKSNLKDGTAPNLEVTTGYCGTNNISSQELEQTCSTKQLPCLEEMPSVNVCLNENLTEPEKNAKRDIHKSRVIPSQEYKVTHL